MVANLSSGLVGDDWGVFFPPFPPSIHSIHPHDICVLTLPPRVVYDKAWGTLCDLARLFPLHLPPVGTQPRWLLLPRVDDAGGGGA